MATTSLAADGRGEVALAEHQEIVDAIMHGHEDKADDLPTPAYFHCVFDAPKIAGRDRLVHRRGKAFKQIKAILWTRACLWVMLYGEDRSIFHADPAV